MIRDQSFGCVLLFALGVFLATTENAQHRSKRRRFRSLPIADDCLSAGYEGAL
jgi:hypothetical protein